MLPGCAVRVRGCADPGCRRACTMIEWVTVGGVVIGLWFLHRWLFP